MIRYAWWAVGISAALGETDGARLVARQPKPLGTTVLQDYSSLCPLAVHGEPHPPPKGQLSLEWGM